MSKVQIKIIGKDSTIGMLESCCDFLPKLGDAIQPTSTTAVSCLGDDGLYRVVAIHHTLSLVDEIMVLMPVITCEYMHKEKEDLTSLERV